MSTLRRRPELRLELAPLGTVDPFRLELLEEPPGSGAFSLALPGRPESGRAVAVPLELAGLHVLGAGQALVGLSARWLGAAGGDVLPEVATAACGTTEVRLVVRRKHARLLGALLRSHLKRLPQPPFWMTELHTSFTQIDEFLRWELEPPEEAQ